MPWDGCELWLADVDAQGRLHDTRRLAGSRDEAVQQPLWSPDGHLHFISDRSGWWNLYRWGEHGAETLCTMQAEFGQPMWNFGLATYGFASARQLVCCFVRNALSQLAVLDTATKTLRALDTPFSSIGNLAAAGDRVLFTGASPLQAASVCLLHLADGRIEILRRGSTLDAAPQDSSAPEAIEFPTAGGVTAHAFFYPPRNHDFQAPPGDKPPLLVMGHGGPTSMATNAYRAGVQYWTSRGSTGSGARSMCRTA
jgi:dipeptidyl aminopeptidase/acylaminoacyl peptidase